MTPENLELKDPVFLQVDASTLRASRDNREKDLVRLAMEKAEGNVSRAASSLGVSRPTLYQLLARYGLKKAPVLDNKSNTAVEKLLVKICFPNNEFISHW